NFRFIIGSQILRNAPDYLSDPLLPLEVPISHLHLTARQTYHCCAPCGRGHRHSKVLKERMKRISHLPVTINKVQHFVKQEKNRTPSLFKNTTQRFCSGRSRFGSR